MLAQKTNCLIDTIEIEKDAFEQAMENISASPWKDRINVYHTDAKEYSSSARYDIIISNPPFYENELRSANKQKNVSHHDDALSLDELIPIIKSRLEPEGRFYLLLPYKRKNDIETLFKKHGLFFSRIELVRQSVNHNYFRVLVEGTLHDSATEETELSIWNKDNQYTPAFTDLLKDYYLYL
jgi:tRNA1Val (adenine37-N6)-methyltransferase